jgi:hypothetical protein
LLIVSLALTCQKYVPGARVDVTGFSVEGPGGKVPSILGLPPSVTIVPVKAPVDGLVNELVTSLHYVSYRRHR